MKFGILGQITLFSSTEDEGVLLKNLWVLKFRICVNQRAVGAVFPSNGFNPFCCRVYFLHCLIPIQSLVTPDTEQFIGNKVESQVVETCGTLGPSGKYGLRPCIVTNLGDDPFSQPGSFEGQIPVSTIS